MIPLPNLRALAWWALGFTTVTLWTLIAYEYGRASTADLARQAFEREEYRAELMGVLVDRSTRAMSIVLGQDVHLHARIREEIPDWHAVVMQSRVWSEVEQ